MGPVTPAGRRDGADTFRPKKLIGLERGAEYLDCSVRSLRNWIDQGRITGYRVGRHIKVDLYQLDAFATPIEAGDPDEARASELRGED